MLLYNNSMIIAGLTGNYGMGKSTVLSMFKKLGAVTIDADKIVGSLLKQKPTLNKIKKIFGKNVFDKKGRLDKKKVAEKVFQQKNLRKSLENYLHPLVFQKINQFVNSFKNKKKIFVVETPLLFEGGYQDKFDKVITVYAKKDAAFKRLTESGITRQSAEQRLKNQLPIKEKLKKTDYKIDNSKKILQTDVQVKEVYKRLFEEAKIKDLIAKGEVHKVNELLGKPFQIEGIVVKGARRGGRVLHTPTANVAPFKKPDLKEGIYAVKVGYNNHSYNGVANIGTNPTFGGKGISYEVHLFDFTDNLFGKKLKVSFIKYIRDEKKFLSVEALKMQISKDIEKAKEILRLKKL
jgi:dephospho-CoA kinase